MDENMVLNDFGRMVDVEWLKTIEIRKNIVLDRYVIMPNHFHGIVLITENNSGKARLATTKYNVSIKMEFGKPQSGSLPVIVGSFKSAVSRQINLMRNTPGKEVWQRNYYEHIIRNPDELNRIREYIINNPLKWHLDRDNSNGIPDESELKFWEDFS
jgi:REP element-mobilizing transposase RayT